MKMKLLIGALMLTVLAVGQTSHPATPKSGTAPAKSTPQAKSASGAATLPSRATVESFLHYAFGWEPQMKVTFKDIKPSPAPGMAEIDLQVATPKGPDQSAIYITSDHKTAFLGVMVPFAGQRGEKPTPAQLDPFIKQMTGNVPGLNWQLVEVIPNAFDTVMEVTVAIANAQGQRGSAKFWITPDGQHAIAGDVSPFGANPFAAAQAQLVKGINGPSRGPATSPILLVEFGDLECPACKAAMPTIDRLLKDLPNARLVFQQFPLVRIHHWAYKAAQYGECVARQNNDAYWKFIDAVYGAQEDISGHVEPTDPNKKPDLSYADQKLTEFAGQAGLQGKQISACVAAPATTNRVDASIALGNQMQVASTPTVFINGRRITNIGSMPYESLKRMVEFMAAPRK